MCSPSIYGRSLPRSRKRIGRRWARCSPRSSADHAAARADALAALSSERYLELLDELASPPPLVESTETLTAVATAQLKKLRKTMRRVDATAPDELLHKARIRGKRLRYVAEALGEKRVVRRAKAFQDVVGEHQDAVVAEQRLRALADRVPEAGPHSAC